MFAMPAIAGIIKGIDYLIHRTDKLKEKAQKSYSNLKNTQSEIDSLNSSLQTAADRIDELNAKQNLSLTESEELKNLQKQNDELERELRLKEDIAKFQGQQANKDAFKYFNSLSSYRHADEIEITANQIEVLDY